MGETYINIDSRLYYRLLHPKLVALLVTRGKDGKVNVMTVAWFMPISITPPLLVVSISRRRFSYRLLMDTREFTLCVLTKDMLKEAHFCGTVSGSSVDKVKALGLRLGESAAVKVPWIIGCAAALECRVREVIKVSTHDLVVGEILAARVRRDLFKGRRYTNGAPLLYHMGGSFYTTLSNEVLTPQSRE